MKLLNVRLGPDDARMAAQLREAGIPVSRIVRDALRTAHARHAAARTPRRRPSEIMAEIYRAHPDRQGVRRGQRDLTDRSAVRRMIRRRLRRRRA
jgi:hypothetical protein